MAKEVSMREAELALRRGAFYGSLARAFGPVEQYLRDGRAIRELRTLIPLWPEMAVPSDLPNGKPPEPAELQAIAAERLRLFERGDCPPYEGSYRAEEDPLKDALMADVAGFYRAFGLEPRHEMPDHLVSELEFMGLLCLQESHALLKPDAQAAQTIREAQRKFVEDHLGRWVERFRDAIAKKSKVSLYPLLADLLVRFVSSEKEFLGVSGDVEAGPSEGEEIG